MRQPILVAPGCTLVGASEEESVAEQLVERNHDNVAALMTCTVMTPDGGQEPFGKLMVGLGVDRFQYAVSPIEIRNADLLVPTPGGIIFKG